MQTIKNLWNKQFQVEQTDYQKAFDIIFGIFSPVLGIFLEPILLEDWAIFFDSSLQVFFYSLTGLGIATFVIWLLWRNQFEVVDHLVPMAFGFGAVISILIGVLALPDRRA